MAAPRAAGPAGVLLMGAARAGEATRPRRHEEQDNTRAVGVAVVFPIGTSCIGVFLRIPCGLAHYGFRVGTPITGGSALIECFS